MQDLTITCIQSDLKWQDKQHNLDHFEALISTAEIDSDLIILPEMFSTGFSMEAELLSEPMDGPTVQWMMQMAADKASAITGSLIIEEDGKYYNRLIFVDGGKLHTYDKRHLFSLLNEGKHYTPGQEHSLISFREWKIQPFVCYDLRFPAWCRNTEEAHLQIYVANWPERRIAHWSALLKARAIENQCYVAAVNRIGKDNNDIYHTGHSSIYDPWGNELASHIHEEIVFTQTLSAEEVLKCREKFPFLSDRDHINFR